ncbi:unnamed protein product [Calypogeia fissa]
MAEALEQPRKVNVRQEASGSLGDLGTFIPLLLAMALVNKTQPRHHAGLHRHIQPHHWRPLWGSNAGVADEIYHRHGHHGGGSPHRACRIYIIIESHHRHLQSGVKFCAVIFTRLPHTTLNLISVHLL